MSVQTDYAVLERRARLRRRAGRAAAYLLLTFWAAMVLFPFYWMILTSLKSYGAYNSEYVPKFFTLLPTLQNYADAFTAVPLGRYLLNTLIYTVLTTAVMLIVATATAVGWFITSAQIPMQVAELFQPLVDSPILLLLSINVFLFLAGMVMDLTPNVLIFAPVFYPLIQQAGIDPYFFGLLFILNLGIGVITPPVGTVLYVVCGIGNIKIGNLVRNMAPFLIVEMLVLFLLLFFPSLSIEPMKFLMK